MSIKTKDRLETRSKTVTVRVTPTTHRALVSQSGGAPTALAGDYVEDGVRRRLYPAIAYKHGAAGRVAYLTGTRWSVWLIADLVAELGGDTGKAAERVRRPAALVQMAVDYARAFPAEIEACRQFAARMEREGGA